MAAAGAAASIGRRRLWAGPARASAFSSSGGRTELEDDNAPPSSSSSPPAPEVKLRRVADETVDRLLAAVREFADASVSALRVSGAPPAALQQAEAARRGLDNLFMVVVVGEFNAGKSTVLNALLGHRYLEEGVTPTTRDIGVLRYGAEERHEEPDESGVRSVYVPVEWLRDIAVVDTPGTNAVVHGHQTLTERFIPHADLVLFVTSCDRAFSESERQFLQLIRSWHKKIVVVLQKRDLMVNAAQLAEVQEFVRANMVKLLTSPPAGAGAAGDVADDAFSDSVARASSASRTDDLANEPAAAVDPIIFPVSGKRALDKKRGSGFSALQSFMLKRLDGRARAKLKLMSPLGVADRLLAAQLAAVQSRADALDEDQRTLATIDRRLAAFRADMAADFETHKTAIDNILLEMQRRAREFSDEELRLTNAVSAMLKPEMLQRKFVDQVAGQFATDVDRLVSSAIDWLVRQHSRQWAQLADLAHQRRHGADLASGQAAAAVADRDHLLLSIGQGASQVVAQWDREQEAARLTDSLRQAVVTTAAVEVGAVGLASVFAASLFDVTGLLGGLAAVGGLAVLPMRRRQFQRALDQRISVLRERLRNALTSHFTGEMESGIAEMNSRLSGYRQFVGDELADIEHARAALRAAVDRAVELRADIDRTLNTDDLDRVAHPGKRRRSAASH